MEFSVHIRWYNGYGGHVTMTCVGYYLESALGDYGPAIRTIDVTACLRSAGDKPMRSLEQMFANHQRYLETLPTVRFYRKKARIEIQYQSGVIPAEEAQQRVISPQVFNATLDEVTDVLKLIKSKLKSSDAFDFDTFVADVERLSKYRICTAEQIHNILKEEESRRLEALAGKSEWELLEIDWNDYHPGAKIILDDPFFWRLMDDFAPHGNDTGADLLEFFRTWNRTHRKTSPLKFLAELGSRWGIRLNPWAVVEPEEVRRLSHVDPIELSICDDMAVALAFASVKCRGVCPPEVVTLASQALQRMRLDFMLDRVSPEYRSERIKTIDKMRLKLQSMTSTE